jgi:site-specific DNA recombinase
MTDSKRAAIYARVSTDQQEREGTSLDSQVARCQVLAKDQGWQVVQKIREQGSGGETEKRPELQGLLTQAKQGLLDVVVCYHIDRLSRDTDDQGWLKTEFRKAGVELVFVTGESNRVLQAVQGAMAQDELEKIRERSSRGQQTKAQQGSYLPGQVPYGFRHRREMVFRTEKVVGLEENPETAPVLREIFQLVASGKTATWVAQHLNMREIPTTRKGRWHHSTISDIIQNTDHKGEHQALKTQSIHNPLTRKTEIKQRPPDQRVVIPVPALVSPDLWKRANDQLQRGRTGARRNNPTPELYLLRAGFVRCGYCSGVISGTRSSRGTPIYKCTQQYPRGCPHRASITAEELDSAVWDGVKRLLQDPSWLRGQFENQTSGDSVGELLASRHASLKQLEQKERNLITLAGKVDDPEQMIAPLNEVASACKLLERDIQELEAQQHYADSLSERLDSFSRWYLEASERIDQMPYEEKRAVLSELGVQVTLWLKDHDPRYTMEWALPIAEDFGVPTEDDLTAWEHSIPVVYTKNEKLAIGDDSFIREMSAGFPGVGIADTTGRCARQPSLGR